MSYIAERRQEEKERRRDEIVEAVTKKWAEYGLPGSGKAIWK